MISNMQTSEMDAVNNPDTYHKWARWNERNILTNLIQAEEHARYIDEDVMDPEHLACISKHLLNVRGELGELMTHTENDEEREVVEDVILQLEHKIQTIQNEGNTISIDEIKHIRKQLEPTMNVFDTSQCRSCGELGKLLRERGTTDVDMGNQEIISDDTDKEIMVEQVDDVDTHNQRRGGMSLSAALDPIVEFSQLPALLDEDPQRVASFWAVPFIAGITDQSLELFTSELGQRVALGTGVLGSQLAIATGRTRGQLTDDLLMMSGVWTSGLFDSDVNEMQQLTQNAALFQEGVQELNFVKVIESLVDTGGSDQLVNDVQSALGGGSRQRQQRSSPSNRQRNVRNINQQQFTTTRQSPQGSATVRTRSPSQTNQPRSSSDSSRGFNDDSPGEGFEDNSTGFNASDNPF